MSEWTQDRVVVSIILLIAGLVLLSLGAWILRKKREDEWSIVARHLRLQFSHNDLGPAASGKFHGRQVELRVSHDNSDTEAGVVIARISVQVRGLPEGMEAEAAPGVIGDITQLAEKRLFIGVESFDQNVSLNGNSLEPVVQYWTLPRQQAFLELVEKQIYDRLWLSHGELVTRIREAASDHKQIEEIIRELCRAADVLDAATSA